jgi:hypothetical protein
MTRNVFKLLKDFIDLVVPRENPAQTGISNYNMLDDSTS